MKIDSEHLEILAAVVARGGLTEGAASLGKSQPSVSRTMALLEARIGAPLFEPGRRPLRPTDLGLRLARIGARIREGNREAQAVIDGFRRGRLGRLRVSGSPIFMDGVVAKLIGEFQVQNPDVAIEQGYGYLDGLAAQLRSGALDLAVLPVAAGQAPADLTFTPLLPGRNVVACRTGHPLTRTKAITAAELARFRWIAPPRESPLYGDLERTLASFGLERMEVAFSGGTYASIVGVLTGSDALTVLPASVMVMGGQAASLAALPLRIEHPDRTLGLLTRSQDEPAVRRFRDSIAAQCAWIDARLRHGTSDARWQR